MTAMNRPSVTFLDVAGDWKSSPHIAVASIEHLKTLLGGLLKHEPGIVNLESSTKDLLQLGIGGPFVLRSLPRAMINRDICAQRLKQFAPRLMLNSSAGERQLRSPRNSAYRLRKPLQSLNIFLCRENAIRIFYGLKCSHQRTA